MTSLKTLMAAFAFFVMIFVGTHAARFPGSLSHLMMVTGNQPILDLQPSFSSAETYQRLEAFGSAGRDAYLTTMLTIDTIFPISAFVFLFVLGRYASARLSLRPGFAALVSGLSVVYLVLDFLENITVAILLTNFPTQLDLLAANIGFLTVSKRTAMFAAFLVPMGFLLARQARQTFARAST